MAIRDIFKVNRKTFINPSAWLDFNAIKTHTLTILSVLQTLFTTPKPLREETFEEAMKRLHLTETDVTTIAKNYRSYALFFTALAFISFVHGFYILFRHGTFIGWVLAMAVTLLLLSQGFKYDFWGLQMRKRKLGLTFSDWKKSVLGMKGGT